MLAVLKRELNAYFSSAIGYVYLAVFYIFAGYFFFAGSLAYGLAELTGVFSSIFTLVMFLIPILTMRLMSEDKKQKTDQLLLTSPLSLLSLVAGKFLAAFLVFAMGVAVTLLYGFVLAMFVAVDWAVIIGNVFGLLLPGRRADLYRHVPVLPYGKPGDRGGSRICGDDAADAGRHAGRGYPLLLPKRPAV